MVHPMSCGGRDHRVSLALQQAHILFMARNEGCDRTGNHGRGRPSQHGDGAAVQSPVTGSYTVRCGPDREQLSFRTNMHQNRHQMKVASPGREAISLISLLLSWCRDGGSNPDEVALGGF